SSDLNATARNDLETSIISNSEGSTSSILSTTESIKLSSKNP
ncbi:hypothetical protein NPIL_308021, partial [Nephila pilipes]